MNAQVPWDHHCEFMFHTTTASRPFGMMYLIALWVCLALWVDTPLVHAQQGERTYSVETFGSGSQEDVLPFWLSARQFGVVDNADASVNGRFRVALPIEGRRLSYRFEADVVGRAGGNSTVYFQQLYGEVRWGPFLLRGGRKEETTGEVHDLSLGSMTLSSNAAPITRISLSWPDFVPIPGTDRFLGVRGYLGHGWIDGNRLVDDVLFHEKYLYLRLGMPDWPVEGRAGLLHYAMWGGSPVRQGCGTDLASSFSDFWRVMFIQGGAATLQCNGEITNVLGNHIGTYDFSLHIDLARIGITAYRQFYLEDTVSLAFRNGWDGMWGLGFTFKENPIIRQVLWEHVNTKRQSSKKDELRGTDNYYNHSIYENGWTHRGRSLGMPLILTTAGFAGVVNNIILAHHLGIEGGAPDQFTYRLFFTFTRNYGAHSALPTDTLLRERNSRFAARVHRYALMAEASSTIIQRLDLDAFARIGYDWGGEERGLESSSNLGFTLGLRRTGVF